MPSVSSPELRLRLNGSEMNYPPPNDTAVLVGVSGLNENCEPALGPVLLTLSPQA
jgi:hypothetical protein